jgi:hypothetical protein
MPSGRYTMPKRCASGVEAVMVGYMHTIWAEKRNDAMLSR